MENKDRQEMYLALSVAATEFKCDVRIFICTVPVHYLLVRLPLVAFPTSGFLMHPMSSLQLKRVSDLLIRINFRERAWAVSMNPRVVFLQVGIF